MSVISTLVRGMILGATLFGTLASIASSANASVSRTQVKGKQITAQFSVNESVTCADGTAAQKSAFVSVLSFESNVRTGGQTTSTLETDIFVNTFDPCTFIFSSASGQFFGGDLPMAALDSGKLIGHYVLDTGLVLDLNLTLTGTETSSVGRNMQRHNAGGTIVVLRHTGLTRSATISSGTVKIAGRATAANKLVDTTSELSRNTGGELIVMRF